MPVNNDTLKRAIHWAVYFAYNLSLLAWVLDYYKSPYDLAYLYIVEGAVIGCCAFLLLLSVVPWRPIWLFLAPGFAAVFAAVVYLMTWFMDTVPYIAAQTIGEHSDFPRPPGIDHPLEVLAHAWKPETIWVLPFMFAGAGYLFLRRHITGLQFRPKNLETKAVAAHGLQRMSMLFWAQGAGILGAGLLHTETGMIYGILFAKIVWDIYENSKNFNPYNFLGLETFLVRGGGY